MKYRVFTYLTKVVPLLACLLFAFEAQAQRMKDKRAHKIDTIVADSTTVDSTTRSLIPLPEKIGSGDFVLNMDSSITYLYFESANQEPVINGFRIQIYFGDLESARAIRAKCRKSLDHNRIYLESITPNYSVAVGDYRDRWEAEIALSEYVKKYRDALIIPSEIKLPELD